MFIVADSVPSYVSKQAGGKGASLCRLARAGLPVPPFAVLPARAFRTFVDDARLHDVIVAATTEDAAARARDAIERAPLPQAVVDAVRAIVARLGNVALAVRSSALDEDGASCSFAGLHDTVLFVRGADEALAALRTCWSSAFSARATSYREERGLAPCSGMAVVFQEMIDADAAAVAFTCDPSSGDVTRLVVNAARGVGEALVCGAVDGDAFTLDKESGAVLERRAADDGDGAFVLDDDDLAAIRALALYAESLFGRPQDLELCKRRGAWHVLQARPVTTSIAAGRLTLFDNSNIVESYGGLTLPLTFDFARTVYRQAYVQFCEILLVPKAQLGGLERYLKNMLGIMNGRVYYNILNWYRLTSILPGFKHNRRFMEEMMGTPHALGDALADEVRALSPWTGLCGRVRASLARLVVGAKFVWYHLTIDRMVRRFLALFEERYAEARAVDYERLSAHEIQDRFYDLERRVLAEWKAPIVNDYLCMVHFGVLRALCRRFLPARGEGFVGELMSGVGQLESAAPARELARLVDNVRSSPRLFALVERTPPDACLEALRREGFAELVADIERYLERYGHRCMDEMKLEAHDLVEDPSFLFSCMQSALAGQRGGASFDDDGRERRQAAEGLARQELSLPRWLLLEWSLAHARRAVRHREATRLCRTRIYGLVRIMMRALGRELSRQGLLDAGEDVFFLSADELFGTLDGTLPAFDLRAQVALRKRAYESYQGKPAPARFETHGPVYAPHAIHTPATPPQGDDEALPANVLAGTPCAPGVVEATVRVVRTPDDAVGLCGEILVAERTDPGWIPLYSAAAGLLVERGGLLSHSAIVARETGLPTIVGVRDLTARLRTGMRVRLDGGAGRVVILDDVSGHEGCSGLGSETRVGTETRLAA